MMSKLNPAANDPQTCSRVSMMAALLVAAVLSTGRYTHAADGPGPSEAFLQFTRSCAHALHADDKAPATLDDWQAMRTRVRAQLLDAWGVFPAERGPLDAKVLGTLQREGYRVERVVFQTRPGVVMTANAYVPDGPGKRPALLMVHGHWKGAKQDPVVQARCIGAVKLGFFVLAVDAFGAGERGIGKALGEYHGSFTAATLLPVGLPLAGLQVYENMRAVDYLLTRPEVDGDRIGITGASGGGNQSLYAGAFDERIKAVVPVCSVGTYDSYLGAACCLCELVPGAIRTTEEWGVLGMVAPRALMVVNATRDARQFSVGEAKKSLAFVEPIFALHGKPANVRHVTFESGHDYSRPMREAMYGWMTFHLKGEGDGSPIAEPEVKTEDPETLRCYPGDTRPDDFITIPRFAATEGRKLIAKKAFKGDADAWRAEAETRRKALVETVFGGFPKVPAVDAAVAMSGGVLISSFEAEPGINLGVISSSGHDPIGVFLDFDDEQKGKLAPVIEHFKKLDRASVDTHLWLRATHATAPANDRIGDVPDHNSAEWAMWIGRPLLGQWVFDVKRSLDAIAMMKGGKLPAEVVLIGKGRGGLVALAAAAVDTRISKVVVVDALASYVTEVPYSGQTLGVMAPGILREVGDVAQLAALVAPRRVVIAGGRAGDGHALTAEKLRDAYQETARAYELLGAGRELNVLGSAEPAGVLEALK